MNPIFRFSEPVSPSGGLQAQGLVNLLGAPPMDPLTLVLREAAQNAWDARRTHATPTMLVRARTLSGDRAEALRDLLLTGTEVSGEPSSLDSLTARLKAGGDIPALEICDFGTEGLNGDVNPVRASSRFVRFFFDIGSPHFDGSTAGTYGFGRASLYLAGEARTIIVDSLAAGDPAERRVMACRLGESFTAVSGPCAGNRHTGRHFWGLSADGRSVQPIVGAGASDISRALGMPSRDSQARSGTSILIPWPQLDIETAQHIIPAILYHNLWPKLVPVGDKVPMRLEVEAGTGHEVLDLTRAHPVYESFAAALAAARTGRLPAVGVGPKNRAQHAAHVAAVKAAHIKIDPPPSDPDLPDPLRTFRDSLGHAALMRASELVVTYRPVDIEGDAPPWVGVVLAQSTAEVASAFAASEPPAHDDWNPAKLKGSQATLVRMTLKWLPEAVQKCLGVKPPPKVQGAEAPSLASAADFFAGQFMAGDGSGAAETSGTGGGGGGSRPGPRISVPEFLGLQLEGERTVARYRVEYRGLVGRRLEATPEVAIEGGTLSETPKGMNPPEVLEWTTPGGKVWTGRSCVTEGDGNYEFAVAYGGVYALNVAVELEPAA